MRFPRRLLLALTTPLVLASSPGALATPGVPDGAPNPNLRPATPPEPCYSRTKQYAGSAGRGEAARIPSLSLTGGEPGRHFTIYGIPPGKGFTGYDFGEFDAEGKATVTNFVPDASLVSGVRDVGPGRKYDIVLVTRGEAGSAGSKTTVETITATAFGMFTSLKYFRPYAKQESKAEVRVSGTPFADKLLYLFLTDLRSGKQLASVRLGTADKCGYLRTSVKTPKLQGNPLFRVYVNAGPKLDKKKAVHPTDQR